ncbi:MAG: hypothetical protein ACR2NN_10045 [Bryobacteraceae bacterium]
MKGARSFSPLTWVRIGQGLLALIAILEGIAPERNYTAINSPWSADRQRQRLVRCQREKRSTSLKLSGKRS